MRIVLVVSLVAAAVTIQAGCVLTSSAAQPSAASVESSRAIAQVSQGCVDAWNHGDLKAYLAAYADSVVVVYDSGPEKGIKMLEARLRQSQAWDGRPPKNSARLSHSEVTQLDRIHALQTAEIIIQEPARQVHLWVTSVLKKTSRGWLVIHEQSF